MDRKTVLETLCLIPVGRTIALCDKEDFEFLRKWEWKLKRRGSGTLFAYLHYKGEAGFQTYYMHHVVLGRAGLRRPSADYACAALNGDSLDCRRENLMWRPKLELKLEAMAAGRERAKP